MQQEEFHFGDFLERLDPIFIFVWILSVFCYLAIALFFISNIFKKTTHTKTNKPIIYCIAAFVFSVSLLIKNITEVVSILSTFYQYIPVIFSFGLCFGILLLASIKKKLLGKSKETHPSFDTAH